MSKVDGMIITVLGWEKFNQRKDVKASSWFRMSHSLLEDSDFYAFTHSEIVAWIYILSLASKKNKATIRINFEHAERVVKLKEKDLRSAILKLAENQCVRVDDTCAVRERDVDDTSAGPTNERTDVRTDERTHDTDPTGRNKKKIPPHLVVRAPTSIKKKSEETHVSEEIGIEKLQKKLEQKRVELGLNPDGRPKTWNSK